MRPASQTWQSTVRPLAALIGLAMLQAGCAATPGGDKCPLVHVADLPLTERNSGVSVAAKLNGQDVKLLFDTGSTDTLVAWNFAKRQHLFMEAHGRIEGVGGTRSGYGFLAHSFQLGELKGRNLQLSSSDVDFGDADGLLGDNFLGAYDVDLDLRGRKAVLFKALARCPTPSAVLHGPLYSVPMIAPANPDGHVALVRVDIDGRILTALVDSGSTHTTIFRNAAHRLGLRLADLAQDPRFRAHGIGPDNPEVRRHVMTPITIGDLTIHNMPVGIIDQRSDGEVDMLLGLDFLSRVHVWLSYSSNSVIMEYPPSASPAIPKN